MRKIVLEKEKIHEGLLQLVNVQHPLREGQMEDLTAADMRFPDILLKREAAGVLQFLIKKLGAERDIVPVSGYRSFEEQIAIYEDSLKDNGEEFTKKYVALPNHSEHQTGLAIDLGLNQKEIDFIRPEFPCEGICEKFRKTAVDYGFIERYAKEKESITGIAHEPWHFRYVGYPHSKIMKEQGLSLEEYTEFLKAFRADSVLFYEQADRRKIEIFYVPADEKKTVIQIPEALTYQISGNNVDGFIITIWREAHDEK